MFVASRKCVGNCIKGLQQNAVNTYLPGRNGQRRQRCFFVAVNGREAHNNFSALRKHQSNSVQHRLNVCCSGCLMVHTRGLATRVDLYSEQTDNPAAALNAEDNSQEGNGRDNTEMTEDKQRKLHHIPVMVKEVLQALQPKNGQTIVDMTFGAGGHAREILNVAPDVRYLASDRDPLANSFAVQLAAENRQIIPILSRFSEIPTHLHEHNIQPGTVDAFLFDLGASSMQFDRPERGFSLSQDGPLDMRMDGDRFPGSPTAADVVNSLSPNDLAHVLKKYGEEKKSMQIAHAIVEARYAFGHLTRTRQLVDVISNVFNSLAFRQDKLLRHAHVATKCFQALRIFVNNELNEINNGLEVARHYLKPNGCCVVISFHSLEDRIAKRHFHDIDINEASNLSIHDHFRNASVSFDVTTVQDQYMSKLWMPLCRKVTEASEDECRKNPRARSAKLRAALKL